MRGESGTMPFTAAIHSHLASHTLVLDLAHYRSPSYRVYLTPTAHPPSVGGAQMAEPYNSFVNLVSFVNMDVSGLLPLNCLSDDYFDHFDQLVTATLFGPLAVLVLVVGVVHPRIGTNASRAKAKKEVEAIIIRILVLIYPTISRIICQSFSVSRGSVSWPAIKRQP